MTALKSMRWRKTTPEKPPEPPAVDLDKLEAALNETSRRVAAQWLGFLSLWAYLFFTTVAVTDYDLLVETPVKLPLIGVELGLFSFFVWTPALFLVVHLYIARKVALLGRQAAFYRKQISAQKVSGAHLAARENRLDAFAVTGWLLRFDAGADQPPDRLLTGFTALTVYVTLFVLPLALYAAFLVYFLAYQHELTTWWHRVALLAGAGLVVYGVYLSSPATIRGEVFEVNAILALLIVSPAFVVFTFPGERLHEFGFADHVLQGPLHINRLRPHQPAHLFAEAKKAGKLDEANQLDLAGRDFSGRTLRNADLRGANLRRARFWNADMRGASLNSSEMQGAILTFASLQQATLNGARLYGANLDGASLQAASLRLAKLQGANLIDSRLEAADMRFSHLQGADLRNASLMGADLTYSHLQTANLSNTLLHGANLSNAVLRGTNMKGAIFWQTVIDENDLEAVFVTDIHVRRKFINGYIDISLQRIPDAAVRDAINEFLHAMEISGDASNNYELIRHLEAAAEGVTPYARAAVVGSALCRGEDGQFALQGVIRGRFSGYRSLSDINAATLLEYIQDVERCPAARGLSEDYKRRLADAVAEQDQAWLWAEAEEWFARAGLRGGSAL